MKAGNKAKAKTKKKGGKMSFEGQVEIMKSIDKENRRAAATHPENPKRDENQLRIEMQEAANGRTWALNEIWCRVKNGFFPEQDYKLIKEMYNGDSEEERLSCGAVVRVGEELEWPRANYSIS